MARRKLEQFAVLVPPVLLVAWLAANTSAKLKLRGVAMGFGFLSKPARLDISESFLPFVAGSTVMPMSSPGPVQPTDERAEFGARARRAALSLLSAAGIGSMIESPALSGFNIRGGATISPELAALVLGLSIYAAAFIAEIVRASVLAVPKGQWEAGRALGLPKGRILQKIICRRQSASGSRL
ncbi:hypothetical protein JKP88DRAFT_290712 [Tribonema minus]|uniref:Uncharacterized protein n=1 Tax=Tribonema minus TaxID=303371 RepID=A0A835YWC5_9STRA|nr:hypothetical protein JKP88DRAFT_290712 [Tribonema minus]